LLDHNSTQEAPTIIKAELSPTTITTASTIQNHTSSQLMKTLLDSGGSHTVIQQRALPKGCVPTTSKVNHTTQTTAGIVNLNQYVILKKLALPEFD